MPFGTDCGVAHKVLVGDATGIPKHQGPFRVPVIAITIITIIIIIIIIFFFLFLTKGEMLYAPSRELRAPLVCGTLLFAQPYPLKLPPCL